MLLWSSRSLLFYFVSQDGAHYFSHLSLTSYIILSESFTLSLSGHNISYDLSPPHAFFFFFLIFRSFIAPLSWSILPSSQPHLHTAALLATSSLGVSLHIPSSERPSLCTKSKANPLPCYFLWYFFFLAVITIWNYVFTFLLMCYLPQTKTGAYTEMEVVDTERLWLNPNRWQHIYFVLYVLSLVPTHNLITPKILFLKN